MAALSDLKVVEFGAFAAGPAVGKHLADHGAEVIHVESQQRLDGFRTNYPPFKDGVPGPERSAMYAITHNDKLGVTLNLKSPEAVALAMALIRRADVVVENFTPGTMSRFGLDADTLLEANPRLVWVSTCNQGQTGPRANHPGFGTHLTSLAGFTQLTGWADREPSLLWGPYIDYIAVAYGVIAVLAAIEQRSKTGRGCRVDLSQLETGIQFMTPVLLDYFATGQVAERDGNRDPGAAPHGIYPTSADERWCAISIHDDQEWKTLLTLLGDPEWSRDEALDSLEGRKAAEDLLDQKMSAWTAGQSREEVVSRLRAAGLRCAPVNDMQDLHSDPQLSLRQVWRKLKHPVIGEYSAVGPPFLLSETPASIESPAPLLGEHNRRVFIDFLGLDEVEFERHKAEGVFD